MTIVKDKSKILSVSSIGITLIKQQGEDRNLKKVVAKNGVGIAYPDWFGNCRVRISRDSQFKLMKY
ncbi:hypothetical protein WN50_39120 [Limnoraphis robusta CS-951]|uniref:Uncharacterized protein n=1 Tax=Limnoraphis robusta CS-951 TaxID=1637645 RepID=A0A0F5YIZ5_9CYAN|nr:hypothetical protein WN50_06230 [Limnoraphis robusta CS-951]KMW69943.1 hypothetical protein WN50_39120 [Limnoraphis robusta CS-951]